MVLIVTHGAEGGPQRFDRPDGLTNSAIMKLTGQSKTQVGKSGGNLRQIAGFEQSFTFANWKVAWAAAAGQKHDVMVGKKRWRSVAANNRNPLAIYDHEETMLTQKRDLGRAAARQAAAVDASWSTAPSLQRLRLGIGRKKLIYQAGYMSGDMFAIGAALRLRDDTAALIIYDAATAGQARRLFDFYLKQRNGVFVARVKVDDARLRYQQFAAEPWVDQPTDPGASLLFDLKNSDPRPFSLWGPGGATKLVAEQLGSGQARQPSSLRQHWTPLDDYRRRKLDAYLTSKNVVAGQRYVVVWTRFSGKGVDRTNTVAGAHPELDVSYAMIRQIVAASDQFDRRVIIVGPARARKLDTLANAAFWGEYYRFLPKLPGGDRAAEYGVFVRMEEDAWNCNVVHVGMRSGAMDAAALLNMRTIFVEDQGNAQIARTTKWTGAGNDNPFYQRLDVAALPTLTGRILHLYPTLSLPEVRAVKARIVELDAAARKKMPPPATADATADGRAQAVLADLEAGFDQRPGDIVKASRGLGAADLAKLVAALTR